ncbi:Telomerase Cajal body protein 1 [Mortierella alpina]|uniref:Telomerase Cajal body protein 1 n=1 Tax=Mortierella alpina TaxID=64518 RepID=A0A9P6J8U2_MORAP|nr:Telomerase Cajal body protein 1 [Mortierella alpina]
MDLQDHLADTQDTHATEPQENPAQEADGLEATADWQAQTFQVFECAFDPAAVYSPAITKSFSTHNTFSSTVGDSRHEIGIKGDNLKMTNGRENNFFKALKWSPDGSCLLSSSNDNCLRIYALPDSTTSTPEDTQLNAGVVIKEGEVVYDMCWYPGMSSRDPASCCVLSSSRDHPVHLWDAYTGELRCSYTIVDHCEVNVAPNALCFNLDGTKIYCGSNNMIQIFDTARPGRDSQKRPTVPTRKSKKGQKGVISCLAFNPDQSDLYAAGSYLKTIGLYDARAEELLLLLRDKSHRPHHRANKEGAVKNQDTPQQQRSSDAVPPMGGVTQLQFSPDGLYLYSASRQDAYIRCWDIRNTAHVLHRLERPGELTNQRIGFDISNDGRWLTTGDMNGDISVFDLTSPEEAGADRLVARYHGHDDVVSAATFHPGGSMLATSSGQRKYELDCLAKDSDSDSDMDSDSDSGVDKGASSQDEAEAITPRSISSTVDNSIRLWSLPGEYAWYVNGQKWTESSIAVEESASEPAVALEAPLLDTMMASVEDVRVEDHAEIQASVSLEADEEK